MVQWLGLRASTVGGLGSIPGRGARILHAVQCGQKKKSLRHYRNLRRYYDDGVISDLLYLIILLIFHPSHHADVSAPKPHSLLQVLWKNTQ